LNVYFCLFVVISLQGRVRTRMECEGKVFGLQEKMKIVGEWDGPG